MGTCPSGKVEIAVQAALPEGNGDPGELQMLIGLNVVETDAIDSGFSGLREWLLEKPALAEAQATVPTLEATIGFEEPILG